MTEAHYGPEMNGTHPSNGAPPSEPLDERPWSDPDGCRYLAPLPKAEREALPYHHWAKRLSWVEKLDKTDEAIYCRPAPLLKNVTLILRHDRRWQGVLAVDEMAKQITTTQIAPWHETEPTAGIGVWDPDTDPQRLSEWLQSAYGISLSSEQVAKSVHVVAQDKRFHPVQEWLRGLPEHDGEPRVARLFPVYCGAPDNAYTHAVAQCLLVGLVARALAPGCKVDTCVVLEGPQGIRKSSFCKSLVGPSWFAESTCDVSTKDAQLAMHGKWLLEMPELAGLTRSQVEVTKAFFSRASDWLRPPYAKRHADLRRSSVPIATTNDSTYLRDRTGHRRFLPIRCSTIDPAAVERDQEQLFAEAFALYQAGAAYWIDDPAVLQLAAMQTSKRETVDPWRSHLTGWLGERTVSGIRGSVGVTVAQALESLGVPKERQGPELDVRIGAIFAQLGLVRCRPRDREAERAAAAHGLPYERPRVYRLPNPDAEDEPDD
jgi:putative DNA primase/helicase